MKPTKKQILKSKYLEAKREWKEAVKNLRKTEDMRKKEYIIVVNKVAELVIAEQKYRSYGDKK